MIWSPKGPEGNVACLRGSRFASGQLWPTMAWYGFSYLVLWGYGGPWLANHGYRWPRVGYKRRVFGLGICHGRQVLGSRGGNPKLVGELRERE